MAFETDREYRAWNAAVSTGEKWIAWPILSLMSALIVFYGAEHAAKHALISLIVMPMAFVIGLGAALPVIVFGGEIAGSVAYYLVGESIRSVRNTAIAVALIIDFSLVGWGLVFVLRIR